MGFFDGFHMPDLSDPQMAARVRGALLGAGQAAAQPYGNLGSIAAGAGQGQQQGLQQYQNNQFNAYNLQQLKDQTDVAAAKKAAWDKLFPTIQGSTPPMGVPQPNIPQGPVTQGSSPIQPTQAVPPPTATSAVKLPPGFSSPEQFQAYATIDPDGAMKMMFAPPEKPIAVTPGTHLYNPQTQQDVFSVPEAVKPPPTAGGMYYDQASGGFKPIPGYTEQAKAIAEAGRAPVQAKQSWQILTDPKTQTQYRYDMDSGRALTLDGKPYTPQAAQKMASGAQPRSASGLAVAKFLEETPNATAEQVKDFAGGFSRANSYGRTLGTRTAAADYAAEEANTFAQQALDASRNLDRGDFKALTQLIQKGQTQASNPKLRALLIATDGLINARARAISPSGQPHVSDQQEGRNLLSASDGPEAYEAGVNQMMLEVAGAKAAGATLGDTREANETKPKDARTYPTPPPAAVQALKMKKDKSQFDEIFGPGAADKALNGK